MGLVIQRGAGGSTGSGGTGDVTGAASSTDNGLVRFDGTSGTAIQDTSGPTLEDSGRISHVTDPSSAQDVATKAYVDGLSGGSAAYVDLLSGCRLGITGTARLYSAKTEYTAMASGATVNLITYSGGAGYIDSLFIAIISTDDTTRSASRVKIYIDGEVSPSIDVPLDVFGCGVYVSGAFGTDAFASRYFGANHNGNGFSVYMDLPIPFGSSVQVDLVNASTGTATVWSIAQYRTGVANTWSRTRKLYCAWDRLSSVAPNTVVTPIDADGKGRVAAFYALVDGFPGDNSPRLASLEGNIKIYTDSEVSASYESSGTEDYFKQGFYFGGAPTTFTMPGWSNVGVAYKDANAVAAFRFHNDDAIFFDTHLKWTWQIGDTSQVLYTGNTTYCYALWYYLE